MSEFVNAVLARLAALEKRNAGVGYANRFIEDGRRDFFIYQATASALAASGVAQDAIQIENDANFYLTKIAAAGLIADDAPTVSPFGVIPFVTVQLNDSGSSRNLFNEQVPLGLFCGQAGLPFVLDYPRLISRNSQLQVSITNVTDNTTYSDIFIAFIGFKVYPGG